MRFFTATTLAILLLGALPAAGDEGRVSEIYPLGPAEAGSVYSLVLEILSPGGRAVLDEGNNRIIVLDVPERQKAVADLVARLQGPPPSVRVESRIVDRETGREAELSAGGQLLLALPAARGSGTVFFDVNQRLSKGTRSTRQFVLVSSGGRASIALGREIPFLNWIRDYALERGVLEKRLDWKEVGSRLSVRPVVIGEGTVRLTVVPELSYLVGRKRQETAFAGVVTEVTVPSGREVRIGGGTEEEEFYRRFLVGYDRQRRVRSVDIYLRATIVEGPVRE